MRYVYLHLNENYLDGIKKIRNAIKQVRETATNPENNKNAKILTNYITVRTTAKVFNDKTKEYASSRYIDFYIDAIRIWLIGFDPNPNNAKGRRFFLNNFLKGIPQGKSTSSMEFNSAFLTSPTNSNNGLRKLENDKDHASQSWAFFQKGQEVKGKKQSSTTPSLIKKISPLKISGSYDSCNITNNLKIDKIGMYEILPTFEHLSLIDEPGKFNNPSGGNDAFYTAFGVMILLISEAVRFHSVADLFSQLVIAEDTANCMVDLNRIFKNKDLNKKKNQESHPWTAYNNVTKGNFNDNEFEIAMEYENSMNLNTFKKILDRVHSWENGSKIEDPDIAIENDPVLARKLGADY
ncbi:hypothetical protein ACJJIK_11420 [Microbulbifer sp. ZKSA006]|uniref:hypothetical protein n=1 Tax=Microbulbifer sp. ZKSA006 TaxID=3243390 RepID=UPI0040398C47